MRMICCFRLWVAALLALMVGFQTQATIFTWDGGAGTDNWKDGNNWNPNGTVVVTNTTGAHRLNVNGAQISNYTADQGTTVYAGDPTPTTGGGRGLVIGSGTSVQGGMRISGGSFSTVGSTANDVIGNGSGSTALLLIDGGTFIGSTNGVCTSMGIGGGPTATLIVSNGLATVTLLTMNATTANLILAGGVFEANRIAYAAGTANLVFDGGTLRSRLDSTNFLQGLTSAKVESRGAVIDTNGKAVTIAQNLQAGTTSGGGLEKTGAGTLSLTGSSTYTGKTLVSNGTLQIGNGITDGAIASSSVISNDAALVYNTVANRGATNNIDGIGSLTKLGAGALTLLGTNSYSGGTTISAGMLVLNHASSVGYSGVISMNGGTLQFSAANTNDYSARLRLEDGKDATFDTAGQKVTFSNALATGSAATAGLAKSGAGTLTLKAANTYKGLTTVSNGTLRIQHANALGTTDDGVTVASGARVELVGVVVAGEAITIKSFTPEAPNYWGSLQSVSGTSEWQGPVTIGEAGNRIGVDAGTFTVSGVIDSGANAYGVTFRPNSGTLVLSGANTYLGDTSIISGSSLVKLSGGANRLPISTKLVFGLTGVSGVLDLNGQDQEVVGLSVNSGTANEIKSVAQAILTINTTNGAPSTFSGKITQNVVLVKKGADSLTLSGTNNTYSGGTIVSNGTLRVSAKVLPVANAVTLAAEGTLDLAGSSLIENPVTIGSLTSSGGLLKISTLDCLLVNGDMAGALRVRLSDPGPLPEGGKYVVAQFTGTPPESVTLEGAAYPWAAKVANKEIHIVMRGGTRVSFF